MRPDSVQFLFILGEWENGCNELQKMLFVRSLRPDRVSFCCATFIVNHLGIKFTEPPVLDMAQVIDDCSYKNPLIFVLSPGVVCMLIYYRYYRY